jgi:electron transport complex protein RnfB
LVDEVYDQLAEALNRLPNGFPRARSNVEIEVLKKIFSDEEAKIARTHNFTQSLFTF